MTKLIIADHRNKQTYHHQQQSLLQQVTIATSTTNNSSWNISIISSPSMLNNIWRWHIVEVCYNMGLLNAWKIAIIMNSCYSHICIQGMYQVQNQMSNFTDLSLWRNYKRMCTCWKTRTQYAYEKLSYILTRVRWEFVSDILQAW
jgi:hypothetical protein